MAISINIPLPAIAYNKYYQRTIMHCFSDVKYE